MRFDFIVSKHLSSFDEFLRYIVNTSQTTKIYRKCIQIPAYLTIFYFLFSLLNKDYNSFMHNLNLLSIYSIFVAIIVAIISIPIRKIQRKKIRNKIYCDTDSNVNFIINDNVLIRENEFSTIKIPLDKIFKIEVLKSGLVLENEESGISIFIPKACLPVTLNEFIDFFKKRNNNLIVKDYVKENNKGNKTVVIVIFIVIIVSELSAYFVAKYNYENKSPVYNLIMESDLKEKSEDDAYYYRNRDLGIGIYFPKSWNSNYGIKEVSKSKIYVYYIPDEKQKSEITLLFLLEAGFSLKPEEGFNLNRYAMKGDKMFTIYTPKTIDEIGESEYKEYTNMVNDITKLKIE